MKISRQLVAFFGKEAIPVVLELGVVDIVEARVVCLTKVLLPGSRGIPKNK
jgi:hypothetical protein